MTILNCTAMTCMYNKDQRCCKGDIQVMGDHAKSADETCCGSFRDRSQESFSNSAKETCGCEKIDVDCKAHECTYNEHCRCTASSIDIAGQNACSCQETRCNTFACRC